MIKATFRLGGEVIEVIVRGTELLFYDISSQLTSVIEGLRLNKAGVIKEFPDLENNPEWKKIAIQRLKDYIKKLKTEMERIIYVKNELKQHGYEPLYLQRAGFRPQKFKDEK
ncbi:MAG TPA: hypothetical protein ENG48_09205 [Candidatus Atribacteria bacterium]|nr:hypothetical protein [Candidatus Atribacteria bacterium]